MKQELLLLRQKLDQVLLEISQLKAIMHSPQPSRTFSIHEAASYLRLSRSRLYTLVYAGTISPLQHRKRGRLLFSQDALDRYLLSNGSN